MDDTYGGKENHTNFEQETERRQPGTGVASGKAYYQILSKVSKNGALVGNLKIYPFCGGGRLHWNETK